MCRPLVPLHLSPLIKMKRLKDLPLLPSCVNVDRSNPIPMELIRLCRASTVVRSCMEVIDGARVGPSSRRKALGECGRW